MGDRLRVAWARLGAFYPLLITCGYVHNPVDKPVDNRETSKNLNDVSQTWHGLCYYARACALQISRTGREASGWNTRLNHLVLFIRKFRVRLEGSNSFTVMKRSV